SLRGYLSERLPGHMVPSALVVLEAMPVGPNGKLDRGALPAPGRVAQAGSSADIFDLWACEADDGIERTFSASGHPFVAPIAASASRAPIRLLGRRRAPVPAGVVGRFAVSGDMLARGYLGQPGRTAARFQPDPTTFVAGARRCLTDDYGRIGDDDALYLLGCDEVRLRGRVVDLPAIEGALRSDARVRDAVARVAIDEKGRAALVAYIVPMTEGLVDLENDLRELLAARLSPDLVPEAIFVSRTLPLRPDGSVDRRQPPAADPRAIAATNTETERMVAAVWKEVLKLDAIPVERPFFELGGNSLSLLTVARLLGERTGRAVTAADLLRHVSIRGLARHLDAAGERRANGDAAQRRASARLDALRRRAPRANGTRS
ncbi:MAG: phosphopantetheine-binding protein, partial [Pseudomonadota bacterium]